MDEGLSAEYLLERKVERWYKLSKQKKESDPIPFTQGTQTIKSRMDRNNELYCGKHWQKGEIPKEGSAAAVRNFVWSKCQTVMANITDQIPKVFVKTNNKDEAMKMTIEAGNELVEDINADMKFETRFGELVLDIVPGGQAYAKGNVMFDTTTSTGEMGEVIEEQIPKIFLTVLDPYDCYPDFNADDVQEGNYFLFTTYKDIPTISEEFGIDEKILKVKLGEAANYTYEGSNPRQVHPKDQLNAKPSEKLYPIVECWYREGDKVQFATFLDADASKLAVSPRLILLKEPQGNPFWFGGYPIFQFSCFKKAHEAWGQGFPEVIESIQEEINKRQSQCIDTMNLTNDPMLILPAGARVGKRGPGQQIRLKGDAKASDFGWIKTPGIDAGTIGLMDRDRRDLDAISRINDVTEGRKPMGITAASAIMALQDAAQTATHKIAIDIQRYYDSLGEWLITTMMQLIPMKLAAEMIGEEKAQAWGVSENGQIRPFQKEDIKKMKWKVSIDIDSGLPQNRAIRGQMAMDMFAAQLIDQEAALEDLNYHAKDEVLERFGHMQMMQQQLEMLQQQVEQMQSGQQQASEAMGESSEEERAKMEALVAQGLSQEEVEAAMQGNQ